MDYLWLLLILLTMVVYPVVLIRSAIKGKRWALDTLEAMRYLGGDMMTASTWRPQPPPPASPAEAHEDEEEPGRLVA